jgi:hypothetical protein
MTRQEYYEHLCELGLPELISASMAAQSVRGARDRKSSSAKYAVYCFQSWNQTLEGQDFWSEFVDLV